MGQGSRAPPGSTKGRLAEDFYTTLLRKRQEVGVKSEEKFKDKNCAETKCKMVFVDYRNPEPGFPLCVLCVATIGDFRKAQDEHVSVRFSPMHIFDIP